MLEEYIDNLKNDIIEQTCKIINIPSVSEETNNPEMPFGEGAKKALEHTLELGKQLGFRTKNLDGYCGYIEFGEGEKLVGIIGHLDVVPSGDGWETPPFEATIKNNKIYGRGAIDDKGPVISSLYAMKAIKDNLKINSRIRLILGVNEEKDWKCINLYKEVEESPTVSFSPDANFPCIYAEKWITTTYLKEDYSKYENLPIIIKEIDCNNNAINVVPKYCKTILLIDENRLFTSEVIDYINTEIEKLKFDIKLNKIENSIELISSGIQAHAAHPELGKNAISNLIILLNRIFNKFECPISFFEFFENHINTEFNGTSLNINIEDESGVLTLNVGNFELLNNALKIGLNLRIPVTAQSQDITDIIINTANKYGLDGFVSRTQKPLYIPKDNELVQTLCKIFNDINNSNYEPIAIGGGTYARAFNNCISFGANFPEDTDMCHQANEFIDIDKLILSCKIYAKTIFELSK